MTTTRPLTRRAALRSAAATALGVALARIAAAQDTAEGTAGPDALTPVRDRYAALQSYADTGTVLAETQWEGAPVMAEGGTFTTFYRAPRLFFFDFVEDEAAGGDRFVIWCDGGDFQSWWKETGQHEVYDGGRGALAFFNAEYPSKSTSLMVPGLIFARVELGGPIAGLTDIRDAGEEEVDGRRFAKIEADTIVAGSVVRPHPTTIWVDPETMLVHKLFEDTPPGAGGVDRRTTVFAPQADPEIDDSRFTFTVPS